MFVIENSLQFVNVDLDYLKKLNAVCPEVYYKSKGYENKPFLGILINQNGKKYVLPLSSAKEKHKTWKDIDKDRFVIFEYELKRNLNANAVFFGTEVNGKVKHILSVIDLKKMIPIKDGLYTLVDKTTNPNDSIELKKYKDLLTKEFEFCLKILPTILDRATKLYDRQIKTGKIIPFCGKTQLQSDNTSSQPQS